MKLAFALCDDYCDRCITDDVGDNAGHVEDTVDTCKEGNGLKMKLSQLVTAYHLANAGIGATFVSDRLVAERMDALNYYKFDSGITTRQFYILLPKRKYVSAAARRFIDYFQRFGI